MILGTNEIERKQKKIPFVFQDILSIMKNTLAEFAAWEKKRDRNLDGKLHGNLSALITWIMKIAGKRHSLFKMYKCTGNKQDLVFLFSWRKNTPPL